MTEPTEQLANDERTTRDRVMAAAIQCIERASVSAVTVRDIAAEAGVNIAAINYHFGSKQKLLTEALEQTLHEGTRKALGEIDDLANELGDMRRAIREILVHLFEGMLRYPRITQWHLDGALLRGDYTDRSVQELNLFLEELLERCEPYLVGETQAEMRLALVQMWSSMMFVGMMPGLYEQFLGESLREQVEGYVDALLGRYFEPEV